MILYLYSLGRYYVIMNKIFSLKINHINKNINAYNLGLTSFFIGIFLLFSAPLFGSIFLLISIVLSLCSQKENPLKDKINLSLILISLLMIVSCLIFPLKKTSLDALGGDFNTHPFIGLLNWLPLFVSFLGFQTYLKTKKNRTKCAIFLICGSIPILVSGFGQYLFNWYGPLEFLNGLVIWYQRESATGMTSIFNNQNYAGCALAGVLPFFFASIFINQESTNKKIIAIILTTLIILGIFFTNSRNGLLGLFIGTFFLIIPLKRKFILTTVLSIFSVFFINNFSNLILNINLIPSSLINRFNFESLSNEPRITIWQSSLKFILEEPILGWGGNNFSSIWNSFNERYYGHSHSVPLEIAIQYGLLTSFFLSFLIVYILIKSFKLIFFEADKKLVSFSKDNHYDRAWFSSSIVILFSNTIDILYFDLRISILLWILLSGLRVIMKSQET